MLWVADAVASIRAGGRCFLGGEYGFWDHELQLHEEHTRRLLS